MNSCSEDPVYWVILTSQSIIQELNVRGELLPELFLTVSVQSCWPIEKSAEYNSRQMSSPVALSLIQVFVNISGQKWLNLVKLYKWN